MSFIHGLLLVIIAPNGSQLGAGGAFQHYISTKELHFNYTKKLSTEARHPRLRQTAVIGCPSVFRHCRLMFNGRRFCPAWRKAHSFASFALCVGLCGLQMCVLCAWLSLVSC
jgi:hypothetical protein